MTMKNFKDSLDAAVARLTAAAEAHWGPCEAFYEIG